MVPSKEIPKKCPECGSERVATIYYGSAGEDPEIYEKMYTGEFYPGGCDVTGESPPAWHCNECEHEWGEAELGE